MYISLKRLYLEFSREEKRRLFFIACIVVLSTVTQVLGIASIFPFITAAANPSIVETNEYLSATKLYFGIDDNRNFIVLLGVFVLLSLVLSNLFLAFTEWATTRFVVMTNHLLAFRLLRQYLNAGYLFHLERNSGDLLHIIANEVTRVVNGGIMSSINIVSKAFTSICILLFLVAIDPVIALLVLVFLGCSYVLIYWSIQLKLRRTGSLVIKLFSERIRFISESLGGIKELKVLGRESFYLKLFHDVSQEMIKHQVFSRVAVSLPKYLLETVAFGGILAITIFLVAVRNDVANVVPMISVYALAGYRLLPALQGIFQSAGTLRHDVAAVDLFYEEMKAAGLSESYSKKNEAPMAEFLPLSKSFVIEGVSFSYPNSSKKAIAGLSMTVKANTSIGIIGSSGSGKSTLIDIILGLLEPQQGQLIVDGQALTANNIQAWQSHIGYVPQVIFLADSTIRENIAFGLLNSEIDQSEVERAASMAGLHDFIVNELDDSYDTVVGEQGVRLSGGQRQRIGIARALYHNPAVLILDEATSALDTPTEQAVMKAIYSLSHKKTIIMIAHRLSTVRNCDQIIRMEGGLIKEQGTFDDLIATSPSFKDFVKSDIK
ncbi:MAG: ABC transporter ATP-binding protein [Cycloclasticus sp.]